MKNRHAILIGFLAILLIVIGIVSKGYKTVFAKAAMICLECIGIG